MRFCPFSVLRHGGLAVAALVLSGAAAAQTVRFVALGDMPYGAPDKSYRPYRALIERVNALQPAFTIHVGDFKAGSTLCSNEEFSAQLEHFGRWRGAVVYTPGDNEWTDCHRANNGGYDPLERLATLRQRFFTPGRSLGQQPITVENQSTVMPAFADYVENQRWWVGDVLFVTVHIVGSNNNFETRDPKAAAEFFARDRANVAWLRAAFELAQQRHARAMVVAMQADPFDNQQPPETFPRHSGFAASIGDTLVPLAAQWGRPVLLIHGDSHVLAFDNPFKHQKKPVLNLTRLQVPGAADVRAVEVIVDARASEPWTIRVFGTQP
ncbi:hypothetical protein Tsedi_01080 [Tepidimonas sediminis]|uniref:Calcineurin-like phosphoesterase domain-containing protein n=1 Tax=Tepidimonas sediminis TaxID=2588941 RepID=A0A554WQJ9_9BURK|nr:hypothetical protein [Tepidimonas sediminis]TSE25856.1 hypothetical protein Tsedi_01080 [Tepidimonas sediminis]